MNIENQKVQEFCGRKQGALIRVLRKIAKWWRRRKVLLRRREPACLEEVHWTTMMATAGSNVGGGVNHQGRRILAFCLGCFVAYGLITAAYLRLALKPFGYGRTVPPRLGCREDGEGSWSIGVFYGDSPFSLRPIETVNIWNNGSGAWPVANPIFSCASVSESGFPSNFVANPFLYYMGDALYLFYETKNSVTLHGDIGVAKSTDKGVTWQQLGIALSEDWHLSFPYVFDYFGNIYMMPEGSEKGDLRVYRATDFPLKWQLEKVVMKTPLIDAVMINHNGEYWLFGSERSTFGTRMSRHMGIWHSSTPLGPWKRHKKNLIYSNCESLGARNSGKPFVHNGSLYRIGQDYEQEVHIFKVEALTKNEYKETEVLFPLKEPKKGRNDWNGARYHHLDVLQLSSDGWVAVMDGDRVPSGDLANRLFLGYTSIAVVAIIVTLLGILSGAVNCIIPLSWCTDYSGKRSDNLLPWENADLFSYRMRQLCCRLNNLTMFLRSRIKRNMCLGKFVLALLFSVGGTFMCFGVKSIFGGNGAEEPYPLKGHYSQFTLLAMTYDARLWNLKMYVKHYSRCASVKEIVVVWNKGPPPELTDLDSAVPIRIRVEKQNSLNNRFKVDPLIKTLAVLELDDDIMMTCDDVERGFRVWREHPDRIVGFYPRFVHQHQLLYRGESYARKHGGYNIILTGAAFIDSQLAFKRYWSDEAKPGREMVDAFFNCEDVLLNFLYANASSSKTVEYVRPAWAIDTSKFSGAAISKNTQVHYEIRSNCLVKFTELYGSLGKRKSEFNGRKDGWDL